MRYGVAIAVVGTVALVRLSLASILRDRAVFVLFVPAVALSAFLGGLGPGLFATIIATFVADLLILQPYYHWGPADFGEVLQIGAFVIAGAFVSVLSEWLHRYRQRTSDLLEDAERDMKLRAQAAARLKAEHTVTRIFAVTESLADAYPQVLGAIRESLGAPVGLLWQQDETTSALHCSIANQVDGAGDQFQFIEESKRCHFARGIGLPGRVWEQRSPEWISDLASDSNFPRRAIALRANLRSGMGFPIIVGEEFFGVMEFFTTEHAEPDDALLNMMRAVGTEIGQQVRRRRAEEQLRHSQRDLKDFVDNAAIGLHWVGPDGTILWANKAELEMLGYASDEYVGRNIAEFHADPQVIQNILRCLSRGDTLNDYEAKLRCKGGAIKHVLINSNVLWEDGKFVHTRCFTRDVTEHVRAEQALRDSEQSLRLAMEAGRMGTWNWDIPSGRVRWSSSLEQMHGLAPGAFIGTFDAFLADVHPDDREKVKMEIAATLQDRRDHHIEYRLKLADGTVRWVEGRGRLSCDAMGNPLTMSGVCMDISSRKVAEQQRDELLVRERRARAESERANKAKDEFLAVLSHELRTPLAPVLLTVSLMEKQSELSPELREDLLTIRRNVELEARLIDDLLDLTRISRGKITLDMQATDLHLLLRNAIDICHRDDSHRLMTELRATRHAVRGDPARLQQVFWNLLNNAHKFTPAGGTITVRSSNDAAGRIVVEVSDTGVGIEPELLPLIFNAFEQGADENARRFGGLGLGLAISKALVDGQGGRLVARSDGKGKGATFVVDMPTITAHAVMRYFDDVASVDQQPVPATTRDEFAAHRARKPLNILVVEDHTPTREVMAKLLRGLGYQTTTACNLESAIGAATQDQFDLVISDLGLPDGTGHELMRQIRQRYAVRGIALSGYGMEEDVRKSTEAGFNEHLTKPIDMGKLQAAIQRVTRRELVT